VPRSEWGRLDGLDSHDLEQVFWYHDAQTDDAALTAAVLRSAQSLGATLAMPARFAGATLHATGARLRYVQEGREFEADARVLVNAAGPWAASVAAAITPAVTVPALELVQGTHIILAEPPAAGAYYLESPRDGRAVFVLPWHGQMLVGTTEVPFRGDPASVAPSPREVNYLLGVLRHYFPALRSADASHVRSAFAGLRVLPVGTGHAFHRSRETLLLPERSDAPRLLSIYGGKLTTWRAVAARVLERITASLPDRAPRARTDQLLLEPA
jgi:glycerol-3-phosphate dehydrogenase